MSSLPPKLPLHAPKEPPPLPPRLRAYQVERGQKQVAEKPSPLLPVEELERFEDLLLFAQTTVDGFFAGRHRSAHPGNSAEFRDYKNYVPGDAIDRLDWRAYGRTRRLYVRRYEDETDLVAYLFVDTSGSMRYAGAGRLAKFQHAARIAAALGYLMIKQGDKAALGLFAERLTRFMPPGGTRRHLHEMVSTLERVVPALGTGLAAALEEGASVCKKRGRLVVLSDFMAEPGPVFDALSQFLHRGFKVLLLQVLDPDELDLPGQSVARYVDIETGEQVEVDAEELRSRYREKIKEVTAGFAREADARAIEYQLVNTRDTCATVLEAYLGFRGRAG